jgi:hypothetical protein
MNKNLSTHFFLLRVLLLAFLLNLSFNLAAQQYLGDNMGSHVANRDLKMNGKNIVNAAGLVIGSASFTNPNVILDINSLSKVMVIPRVTNIATLTGTIDNGSMAYDVATNKFYIRENNAWSSFGDFNLASGQVMLGNSSNRAVAVALSGDVTVSPLGVTTIGEKKVTVAKLATAGTADANKVFATNITSGDAELISKNDLAIPKYTLAQRNAIASPANNMLIFNTDSRTLQVYDSTIPSWVNTGSAASSNLPVVSTAISPALSTKADTAFAGGTVNNPGILPVTARGICWNTATGPTTSNFVTNEGSGAGTFSSTLYALKPSTLYYIRAYAINALGTVYGNEITITTNTAGSPIISATTSATNITYSSATSGGTISNDRGAAVTARGIVWNTTGSPLVTNASDSKAVDPGTGIGSFQSDLTGLTASTKYFVRAYATNSTGTSYGPQVEITTATPVAPILTTATVVQSGSTVTVGGTVTSTGGAPVTSRGVYYSTSSTTPTSANSSLVIGSGTGTFNATLAGLTQNTTYNIRAFAINSSGTGYGNLQTFTTNGPPILVSSAITVNTLAETSITLTSGLTSNGGDETTTKGFVYNTSTAPTISNSVMNSGTGTGSYTSTITGLTSTTTYYFRAFATNSFGTVYGPELIITTRGSRTFNLVGTDYSGSSQQFIVPYGVTSINIKAYGAQGGGNTSITGGLGGYAEGQLTVSANQVLNIYVGGAGYQASASNLTPGGWNGGGSGYGNAGTGGGASDIRINGSALSNRVIVAGGGGGATITFNSKGGAGGGDAGADGQASPGQQYSGKGGTQTAGGAGQTAYTGTGSTSGSLGTGGSGGNANSAGGGGGGGYYGGGGGDAGGGGGGSGMVGKNASFPMTNPVLQQGVNTGSGKVVISW